MKISDLLENDGPTDPGRRRFLKTTGAVAAQAAMPGGTAGSIAKLVSTPAKSSVTLVSLAAGLIKTAYNNNNWFWDQDRDWEAIDDSTPNWEPKDVKIDPKAGTIQLPFGNKPVFNKNNILKTPKGRQYLKIFDQEDEAPLYSFENSRGKVDTLHFNPAFEHRSRGVSSLEDSDSDLENVVKKIIDSIIGKFKIEDYRDAVEKFSMLVSDENFLGAEGYLIDSLAEKNPDIFIKFFNKHKDQILDKEEPKNNEIGNVAKDVAKDIVKDKATDLSMNALRTASAAGALDKFKELVKRVIGKIEPTPDQDKPVVKHMGKADVVEPNQPIGLPAPDKSDAEIMADLRDIINRQLTDREKEVVRQEIKNKDNRE
jgi:hypothetical protein